MMSKRFFFLFVLSCYIYIGNAQLSTLKEDGVLVVRLESGHNKMVVLEKKIQTVSSDSEKTYWENELNNLRNSIRAKNLTVISAFEENYNFSDILYIYDTASVVLKNGQNSGFFLDEELEVDESIDLQNRFFLLATEGRSESSAEGIYILDSSLERLQRPLPHFVKLNSLGLLFNNLFSSGDGTGKMYSKAVEKLNMKFHQYALLSKP